MAAREASRTRSRTTKDNLRKQCAAARKTDEHDMNAQDCTLQCSGANARLAGDDEEMQRFVPIEDLFKGRNFDRQIIVLCVSWYTSFKLSLRDLVIMMADRGISVTQDSSDSTTRWKRSPESS